MVCVRPGERAQVGVAIGVTVQNQHRVRCKHRQGETQGTPGAKRLDLSRVSERERATRRAEPSLDLIPQVTRAQDRCANAGRRHLVEQDLDEGTSPDLG